MDDTKQRNDEKMNTGKRLSRKRRPGLTRKWKDTRHFRGERPFIASVKEETEEESIEERSLFSNCVESYYLF